MSTMLKIRKVLNAEANTADYWRLQTSQEIRGFLNFSDGILQGPAIRKAALACRRLLASLVLQERGEMRWR